MYPLFTKAPCTALNRHVTPASSDSYPCLARKTIFQTILAVAVLILTPTVAHAGSATWDLNPTSGDWNTAGNWTPMTVPNGPADIATFPLSSTASPSISANTEVNAIVFAPGTGYTITVDPLLVLTISGTGVTGAGRFVFAPSVSNDGGEIEFPNSSTAGDSHIILSWGGFAMFTDNSTAGSSIIDQFDGAVSFNGNSTAGGATVTQFGLTCFASFNDSSTAGHALIFGGDNTCSVEFSNTSSAGTALVASDGAFITFADSSTAGGASIPMFAGVLLFSGSSTGGTAQIDLEFNGNLGRGAILYVSGHNFPGVTIGSIEGDESSSVFLGANNLTVGSNDLSTTFFGVIEDEGFSGSLTKIGKGTLDLKGANTFTGQTNVNGGVLQVDGSTSSNTFINHKGTLAGGGTVNRNVTNYGGAVTPGDPLGVPGVLTVSSNYMQTSSGTLAIQIGGADLGQASVLNVLGNANLNGSLDPELVNGFVPDVGQSFTILGYASVTGSFSHIQNQVFDNGRKRWALVYQPTGAALVVVNNGRQVSHRNKVVMARP
jgi:autotransporter-associated beta strand protein